MDSLCKQSDSLLHTAAFDFGHEPFMCFRGVNTL